MISWVVDKLFVFSNQLVVDGWSFYCAPFDTRFTTFRVTQDANCGHWSSVFGLLSNQL